MTLTLSGRRECHVRVSDCRVAMNARLVQIKRDKLVNAKYCDKFPHLQWKDGQVMHVQVTPELHRRYASQIRLALDNIQQR